MQQFIEAITSVGWLSFKYIHGSADLETLKIQNTRTMGRGAEETSVRV